MRDEFNISCSSSSIFSLSMSYDKLVNNIKMYCSICRILTNVNSSVCEESNTHFSTSIYLYSSGKSSPSFAPTGAHLSPDGLSLSSEFSISSFSLLLQSPELIFLFTISIAFYSAFVNFPCCRQSNAETNVLIYIVTLFFSFTSFSSTRTC